MVPNPVWLAPLRRNWDPERHEGCVYADRRSCGDRSKVLSARKEASRNQIYWHLDLGLPASRAMRQYTCFLSPLSVLVPHCHPSKPIQEDGFLAPLFLPIPHLLRVCTTCLLRATIFRKICLFFICSNISNLVIFFSWGHGQKFLFYFIFIFLYFPMFSLFFL